MGEIDIESLLSEVSPELPCGENLTYDQAYLELERMFQSSSAGMVESGEEVSEEPNWQEARNRCVELLGRMKELRLILYLTLSLLRTDGLSGLNGGLAVLRGVLERFWDHVYPQLDPEDNNDPLERVNIIASIAPAAGSYQDPMMFKQRLFEAPLCNSRRLGKYGYRDILIARGEITVPVEEGTKLPDMAILDAAFDDVETEELQATNKAASEAIDHVKAIENILNDRVGVGKAPNLSGFQKALTDVQKCVGGYLAKRGYGQTSSEGQGPTGEDAGQAAGAKPISGEICSDQDVLLALEKICQYYERNEPSSPVPLLLRRARRLVSKSFMDIIRDVSPDSLGQIENITGIDRGEAEG